MQSRYDTIYLSPHLDDAVLSCGGRIHQQVKAGQSVLIATPTAGDEPAGLSDLAREMHACWGLKGSVVSARREEDKAACKALGTDWLHGPFVECIYRQDVSGGPLYRDMKDIFSAVHPRHAAQSPELFQWLERLPPAAEIVAPLAVGNHVDHQWVRAGAEQRFGHGLVYYEDYPYAGRVKFILQTILMRIRWNSETARLSDEDIRAKCRAIAAYASQARAIFKDEADLEFKIRRYARRVGGERVWRRK